MHTSFVGCYNSKENLLSLGVLSCFPLDTGHLDCCHLSVGEALFNCGVHPLLEEDRPKINWHWEGPQLQRWTPIIVTQSKNYSSAPAFRIQSHFKLASLEMRVQSWFEIKKNSRARSRVSNIQTGLSRPVEETHRHWSQVHDFVTGKASV